MNSIVCVANRKRKACTDEEYHHASFSGSETAVNFRKHLQSSVSDLELVSNGLDHNGIDYIFRLLVCCDYPALVKLFGCGHQNARHRCVICDFDVNDISVQAKKRRWDASTALPAGILDPMLRLGPDKLIICPDVFHMRVNIARKILARVNFVLLFVLALLYSNFLKIIAFLKENGQNGAANSIIKFLLECTGSSTLKINVTTKRVTRKVNVLITNANHYTISKVNFVFNYDAPTCPNLCGSVEPITSCNKAGGLHHESFANLPEPN